MKAEDKKTAEEILKIVFEKRFNLLGGFENSLFKRDHFELVIEAMEEYHLFRKKEEQQVDKEEMPVIDDLKQYVTNLLYAAFHAKNYNEIYDPISRTSVWPEFDKWVEEQVSNISDYFASQSPSPVSVEGKVTDEDIDSWSFGRSENLAQESLFDRGYLTGLKHGAIAHRDGLIPKK